MDVISEYKQLCDEHNIPFRMDSNVLSYDETTLFCPAGMQQYKKDFPNKDIKNKTYANIQSCIRLNDYDEIGDGTHCICFDMMGLFSFRHMTLQQGIDFWMEFVINRLKLKIDYVTIHPDKYEEWKHLYKDHIKNHNIEIKKDDECVWSDGIVENSYCTEFFIGDIEIGNIVNNNGDCLDVGFGYERLESLVNPEHQLLDKNELFVKAINKIVNSGVKPGANKQGYILRKLYRDLHKNNGNIPIDNSLSSKYNEEEKERHHKLVARYEKLKDKPKYKGKSKEYWFDTHGIDLDLV